MKNFLKKLTIMVLLLLMMICIGCSTSKESNGTGLKLPTIILPDLRDQNGLYVENIDGLFDTVQFIALQTDTNCLIGEINKIEYFNGRFFILDWSVTKTLFCFNEKGVFQYKINNLGRGPSEFISPMDFTINDQKEEISLLDVGNKKIITYDVEGNFKEEIRYLDSYKVDDISFIHKCNDLTYVRLNRPEPKYNTFIKVYNKFEELRGLFKVDKYNWNIPPGFESRFSRNSKGSFLYISNTTDTIYIINESHFLPLYYVEFNGGRVCYEELEPKNSDYEKCKAIEEQKSYQLGRKVFKAGDKIFFSFSIGGRLMIYNVFYEEKSNRIIISHFINDESDVRFSFIDYPKGVIDDSFFSVISASVIERKIESLIEKKKLSVFDKKEIDILKAVSEYDNPIIVIYK